MDVHELLRQIGEGVTARSVFAEPYERDGLAVIPVAAVRGGGGGGGGSEGGGGFGVNAHPTGAFVVENGRVRWQPAVDVNRVLAFAVVALLTLRSIARIRARTKRKLA
jgi:uncharacterized spore protein YtfJ